MRDHRWYPPTDAKMCTIIFEEKFVRPQSSTLAPAVGISLVCPTLAPADLLGQSPRWVLFSCYSSIQLQFSFSLSPSSSRLDLHHSIQSIQSNLPIPLKPSQWPPVSSPPAWPPRWPPRLLALPCVLPSLPPSAPSPLVSQKKLFPSANDGRLEVLDHPEGISITQLANAMTDINS